MTHLCTILVRIIPIGAMLSACAISTVATFATETIATPRAKAEIAPVDDVSATKRTAHYRHSQRYHAQRYHAPQNGTYGRGNDPSLRSDGRPYRVPGYLQNQCHIDEGYGRFSACPNE